MAGFLFDNFFFHLLIFYSFIIYLLQIFFGKVRFLFFLLISQMIFNKHKPEFLTTKNH
jgi:hypothetical protein